MKIVVLGGGFVGQLVQLQFPNALLLDNRKSAPQNHLETRNGPQYLWEPIPGVHSESFPVQTSVDGADPTPESILAYKRKIGKENDGGDWGLQFRPMTTGWNSLLPIPKVIYAQDVWMVDLPGKTLGMKDGNTIGYDFLINTIPLPQFLNLLIVGPAYSSTFEHIPIYMRTQGVFPSLRGMHLNYLSSPTIPFYRATLSGAYAYYESITHCEDGKKISPGKLLPNKESERILTELAADDCFCFGRFATWRPDELGHETWRHIEKWKETL